MLETIASSFACTSSVTPSGIATTIRARGSNGDMERDKTPAPLPERIEIREEANEARKGDKDLDEYDKELADSFPASDPPAQP